MAVFVNGDQYSIADIKNKDTIFLVGPSKRENIPFTSYRKPLIPMLLKDLTDCVIFNPEYDPDNGYGDKSLDIDMIFNKSRQWELAALDNSKIVIIGLDMDEKNLGLTTRTEFGFLVKTRRNLIVYAPQNGYKIDYIVETANDHHIPICTTLDELVSKTKTMCNVKPIIKQGKFNSTEIYSSFDDPVVLRETINQEETLNRKGAIWVYIKHNDTMSHGMLINLKYHFHHHDSFNNIYAFYKWNDPTRDDVVPEYATAIGGACAMILNKNETKVLLVYEESYGKKCYKFCSGSVQSGELAIECMLRELMEELNLTITDIDIKLVGGYNQKKARYNKINDYFLTFVVNIDEGTIIKPDGIEVLDTKWLDIETVISGKITNVNGVEINKFDVNSLKEYKVNNRYLPCKLFGNKLVF